MQLDVQLNAIKLHGKYVVPASPEELLAAHKPSLLNFLRPITPLAGPILRPSPPNKVSLLIADRVTMALQSSRMVRSPARCFWMFLGVMYAVSGVFQ